MLTFSSEPEREFTFIEDSRAIIRRSSLLRIRSGTSRRLYSSPLSNKCSKCMTVLNSVKYLGTDHKEINIRTATAKCFSSETLSKPTIKRFEEKVDTFCVCGSVLKTRKILADNSANLKEIEDVFLTDCTNYSNLQTKIYRNETNRVYHVKKAPNHTKFKDHSQTASGLSCFESSGSVNDTNCMFCVGDEFSNVPKNSKTMSNVTEKTRKKIADKRARTIYNSPKKTNRGFCNSSSHKQDINVLKINKNSGQKNIVLLTCQRQPVVLLERCSFGDIDKKKIKSSRKKSSFKSVNNDIKLKNKVNNLRIKYKDVIKDVSVCITPLSVSTKQNYSKTPSCSTNNWFKNSVLLKKMVDDVPIDENATRFSRARKVSKKNLESDSIKKKKTIKETKNKLMRNDIRKKSPVTKMLSASPDKQNVTFSSKGRARLPRLEYWRGERMSTVEDFTIYVSEVSAKPQKVDKVNCTVVKERNVNHVGNSVTQKNRTSKINFDSEKINSKLSVSNGKRNVDRESTAKKSRYKKQNKNNKSNCKRSSLFESPRRMQRDSSRPSKKRKLFSQYDADTVDLNEGCDSVALQSCLTEKSESRVETIDLCETNSVPSKNDKLEEKWLNEIFQKIGPSSSKDAKLKSQTFSGDISPIYDRTLLWIESNFSKTQPPKFLEPVKENLNSCRKKSSTVNKKDTDLKSTTADKCAMEIDKSYRNVPSGDVQKVGDQKTAAQSDSEMTILITSSSDSEPRNGKEMTNVSSDELRSYPISWNSSEKNLGSSI